MESRHPASVFLSLTKSVSWVCLLQLRQLHEPAMLRMITLGQAMVYVASGLYGEPSNIGAGLLPTPFDSAPFPPPTSTTDGHLDQGRKRDRMAFYLPFSRFHLSLSSDEEMTEEERTKCSAHAVRPSSFRRRRCW
ncbi:hypothetical protein PRIPAC_93034 [Pristionchus pacificus]|uniref:Uncharacterized protein n=1 Tax=Pristionchus pacificus TaxID=54126 RepID=A0A8R1YY10_PRIPA|nr:hypothetical protein PRIPAC_93034 [Pristionchus pacificus]|eukprot:PDM76374.1 hypothetical protein PRIPAC_39978 [Pristionchus pacificus]